MGWNSEQRLVVEVIGGRYQTLTGGAFSKDKEQNYRLTLKEIHI